MNNNKLQS